MSNTQVFEPVVISAPPAERLAESEAFVINGIRYTVDPDVDGKVRGGANGKYWVRPLRGFAGREFVIVTFDGRRIVTRNLWIGEETDDEDDARFEGREARPVKLRTRLARRPWELR